MNRKKSLLGIIASLSLIKLIPFVSAFDISQGPRDLIRIVVEFVSPFFAAILGTDPFQDFFFAKVLLLILLFVVIVFVLNKARIFGELTTHPGVIYTIATIVSVLAMRYLPESDLIKGILLPYSALGIAITTFLPLIIYFFFIHNSNFGGFGRRAGWALYGIVFLALWLSKDVQLSDTSNWIYWGALAFVGLSLIFDKSIHTYFALHELNVWRSKSFIEREIALKAKLKSLRAAYDEDPSRADIRTYIEEVEKQLKNLKKQS